MGFSDETGYLIRRFGGEFSNSGFDVIDTKASFTQEEQIAKALELGNGDDSFWSNYPLPPQSLDSYSFLGLSSASTTEEYQDVARSLLADARARLKGQAVVLSAPTGYHPKGIAGNHFVLTKGVVGSREVYRCDLSSIVTNDIDQFISTCNLMIPYQNDEGTRLDDGAYTRFVNNSGYLLYPPSYGKDDFSVVYPDGARYSIPAHSSIDAIPFYLSDDTPPKVYGNGSVYELSESGPNLIETTIDLWRMDIERGGYLYSQYYHAARNGFVPAFYFCEKGSDIIQTSGSEIYSRIDFSYKDKAMMLYEVMSVQAPEVAPLYQNYPELPSDELLDSIGGPFYAGMSEGEYISVLNQSMDDELGGIITNYQPIEQLDNDIANTTLNLACKDGKSISSRQGSFPSPGGPFDYMSDNGLLVMAANGLHHGALVREASSQEAMSLNGVIADYMLESLDEKNRDRIIEELRSESQFFISYPEITPLTKITMIESEEEKKAVPGDVPVNDAIHHFRGIEILKKLGVNIPNGDTEFGNANIQISGAGVVSYAIGKDNTDMWLVKAKVVSSDDSGDSAIVEIVVNPADSVIDPYDNPASQFSIDVSGSDVYGLDVSCNLSSSSLTINNATYNSLFGLKDSMTLPIVFDDGSVTGTETLVAPELPFEGEGSFVLADVIAEFTTEDVDVVCAAEVSDQDGNLLQVGLTPATITIDDGVHGGGASVSGTITIPGVDDLSGIEVVLTIDGRQVTVVTDADGNFSFDGLRDGEFTISMNTENYVQSCQEATVTDGDSVDLGNIEMLAGDINADGAIDIADFTYMAARYRAQQGDADYDAKADLNSDGIINIQDLAILASHFGSTQCNPVQ